MVRSSTMSEWVRSGMMQEPTGGNPKMRDPSKTKKSGSDRAKAKRARTARRKNR